MTRPTKKYQKNIVQLSVLKNLLILCWFHLILSSLFSQLMCVCMCVCVCVCVCVSRITYNWNCFFWKLY